VNSALWRKLTGWPSPVTRRVSIHSVLDVQRSLYTAQQGLVTLRLAKLANNMRLYAVLGGGWQIEKQPVTAYEVLAEASCS